jgi:hypothetical protein
MTALELEQQGIHFEWKGGRYVCFGPADHSELHTALRDEIARRQAIMAMRIISSRNDYRAPVACLLESVPAVYGVCISCGESLGASHLSGDCCLCVAARYKALVAAGRLAG